MDYSQALKLAVSTLREVSSTYQQDGLTLLCHILNISREEFYSHSHSTQLSPPQQAELADSLSRMAQEQPLAQVIGKHEFCGHQLSITPDVLIPRPETEELVGIVLARIRQVNSLEINILEVGMGSGCITLSLALALASSKPQHQINIVGLEPSPAAFQVACQNISLATKISPFPEEGLITFRHNNLHISCINKSMRDLGVMQFAPNLIVSNPPYITTEEYVKLARSVKQFEPRIALEGGEDGLQVYREIMDYVAKLECKPEIFLEISPAIVDGVEKLLHDKGKYTTEIKLDLWGRQRFAIGQTNS